MFELLQPSYNLRNNLKVNYFEYTGEWQVEGRNRIPYNNINTTVTYGTKRMNAYQIIHETLNLRDVKGKKTDKQDAKWIADIFKHDLINGSFIPPEDIRQLRDLMRYLVKLTAYTTGEKNKIIRHKLGYRYKKRRYTPANGTGLM